MSTSVNDSRRKSGAQGNGWSQTKKALVVYVGVTLFCLLFSTVYAQFSHEVSSPFMTFMFLIPLIGGGAGSGIRLATGAKEADAVSRYAYHSGIAALTVASTLKGIFDIAGTSSPFLPVYVIAAAALIAYSAIRAARTCRSA